MLTSIIIYYDYNKLSIAPTKNDKREGSSKGTVGSLDSLLPGFG